MTVWFCLNPVCEATFDVFGSQPPAACPNCRTKRELVVETPRRVVQMLTNVESDYVTPTDPYIKRLRSSGPGGGMEGM
jgi:hypothetical protein